MESPEGQRFPNIGSYLEVIPNKRLTFTSVMLEDFRPAPKPENGAMDMPFTASIILKIWAMAARATSPMPAMPMPKVTRPMPIWASMQAGVLALDQLVAADEK